MWRWFSPVQPSAWRVPCWPLTTSFASLCIWFTRFGVTHVVRTLPDTGVAAGRKSWRNRSHSMLSTHASGSPALAVSHARQFSNIACHAVVQIGPILIGANSCELIGALSAARCKLEEHDSGARRLAWCHRNWVFWTKTASLSQCWRSWTGLPVIWGKHW